MSFSLNSPRSRVRLYASPWLVVALTVAQHASSQEAAAVAPGLLMSLAKPTNGVEAALLAPALDTLQCLPAPSCSLPPPPQGCLAACEDNNPCTLDRCERGRCVHLAANGASCNDGNLCTERDVCMHGACVGKSPRACKSSACQASACNPATGACDTSAVADGTVCNNKSLCDGQDTCRDGRCVGSAAPASVIGSKAWEEIHSVSDQAGNTYATATIKGSFSIGDAKFGGDDRGDIFIGKFDRSGALTNFRVIAGDAQQQPLSIGFDEETGNVQLVMMTTGTVTLFPRAEPPILLTARAVAGDDGACTLTVDQTDGANVAVVTLTSDLEVDAVATDSINGIHSWFILPDDVSYADLGGGLMLFGTGNDVVTTGSGATVAAPLGGDDVVAFRYSLAASDGVPCTSLPAPTTLRLGSPGNEVALRLGVPPNNAPGAVAAIAFSYTQPFVIGAPGTPQIQVNSPPGLTCSISLPVNDVLSVVLPPAAPPSRRPSVCTATPISTFFRAAPAPVAAPVTGPAETCFLDTAKHYAAAGGAYGDVTLGNGQVLKATDSSQNAFLASYAPDAETLRFARMFGGPGSQIIRSITEDNNGDIVVYGEFEERIDLGGGELVSKGASDLFLAIFAPDGSLSFQQRFGGAGKDSAVEVKVSPSDNALSISGSTDREVDFGDGPRNGNFLVQLTPIDAVPMCNDDNNPCTVGSCHPKNGCKIETLKDGTACTLDGGSGMCMKGRCKVKPR